MPNPNLRKCGHCGHAWGEHRLEDQGSPVTSPCMLCPCADFGKGPDRPTGRQRIAETLERAQKEEE